MSMRITQDRAYRQARMPSRPKAQQKPAAHLLLQGARGGKLGTLARQTRRHYGHLNQHTEAEQKLIRDLLPVAGKRRTNLRLPSGGLVPASGSRGM